MKVTVHDRLPPEPGWARLFAHCAATDAFASRAWYENFIATVVGTDGAARFLVAEDESGEPAAILPIWQRAAHGVLGPKRLESLGNYYTCLYQPLLCADQPLAARALDALVDHLVRERGSWSVLELRPLPDDAWYLEQIRASFARHGLFVETSVAFGNWYIDVAGMSFAAYFESRRKKMRSTVRGKTNQLQTQYAFEIRILDQVDDVAAGFEAYRSVYESSWKQAEPYPEFIPSFMRLLAERGQLRLGILTLDERPVAAQMWFVANGVAHIFKLAYDGEFSQFSVGTLLTMKLMEHVLDVDKVDCVDFLSGDDEYKQQWMSTRRERVALEVVNDRSVAGLLLNTRRRLGRLRRRWQSTT